MISDLYHHHQNAPLAVPSPAVGNEGLASTPAQLSAHFKHLESLLDSALATLTLIHTTSGATPPFFASRTVQLTQALTHFVSHSAITTPNPTATTTPTTSPTTLPLRTATTAPTTAPTASNSDSTPASVTCATASSQRTDDLTSNNAASPAPAARVILRFDEQRQSPSASQPHRAAEWLIDQTITKLFAEFNDTKHAKMIAGVEWSRKGNLVLLPAKETCTAKFLAAQKDFIWPALRPILKLPEGHACPSFDTDERWHSVVFHRVPMPATRRAGAFSHQFIQDALKRSDASRGVLKSFSLLCRPTELVTQDYLALRVSLSAEADAIHLINNGGHMAGAWCRVTPYMQKKVAVPST
ncbi:hypothetical protein GGX14DRAFT_700460 [Mycena pura]|uniref:Uncharacterized protein n=1 Tax=Mycena pura TaxID=153505 RepID=A0AAD6Y4V9_9AGAR|nr:hypothetical protein GGX14DRAFT_700460 [Mycena pura]